MKLLLKDNVYTELDKEDFVRLKDFGWRLSPSGYAAKNVYAKTVNGKEVHKWVWLHKEILRCEIGEQGDHINGNTLDNRKSNLRVVSTSQNMWNSKTPKNNTSGYKGVSKVSNRPGWSAMIGQYGKKTYIGYFKTALEAAQAYDQKALELFGEFAKFNLRRIE